MSIVQFIQYNQVDFLNEFWHSLRPEAQIFYDRGSELFLFRELNSIYIINKHSLNKVTRIKIPYNDIIYSMNIQIDYHYIAYQTHETQLNIFSIRANRQFFYKLKTDILQFEWTRTLSGFADLIVVETQGLHLLKIEEQIKEIKYFQHKINCCWYEPKCEVLVTLNFQQNGLLSTYFFNEKRKDQKYKGQEFYVEDFEPKETGFSLFKSKKIDQHQFIAPTDRKNKDLSSDDHLVESTYKIYLVEIYGKSVLAYCNSFSGKIIFYLLSYEKINKQKYALSFPSDIIVNLSVVDNLVILSTINEKISIVFDVKKNRADAPLGPPQSILQQNNITTIKVKDIDKHDKQQQQQSQTKDLNQDLVKQQDIENIQIQTENKELTEQQVDVVQNTLSQQKEQQQQQQEQEIKQEQQQELKPKSKSIEQIQNEEEVQQEEQLQNVTQEVQEIEKLGDLEQIETQENILIKDNQNIILNQEIQQISQQQLSLDSDKILQEKEVPVEQTKHSELYFTYDVKTLKNEIQAAENYFDTFLVKMKWNTLQQTTQNDEIQSRLYEPNCIFCEDDIIVNHKVKEVYQFNLNLKYLPSTFEDELEAYCGLLRRSNCKTALYEYLIELVLQNKPIAVISQIFKNCLDILVRALQERQANKEIERLKNGYSVLYPSEMQYSFFQALADNNKVNKGYVIDLIIEFIRQFQETMREYKLIIPSGIQNLLIKLLIKENKMTQLHFLLQYHVLTDNVDFARLLLNISSKTNLHNKYQLYEPAYQLSLDMFYRLQKYDEVLEILLKHGKFHDAAVLIRKISTLKIRLPPIQEGIRYSDCSREDLIRYLEDLHRKGRLLFQLSEINTL